MKTKLLTLLLFFSGMSIYAGTFDEPGFIITNHDTTICKRVLIGNSEAKVELINGSVMNINKNEILAFKSNGKYYEKKEIYLNNKATGINALMEFVAQRNGLKLFCYRSSDGIISKQENSNVEAIKDPILLLVYKNDGFYLQPTRSNISAILDFFHVDGAIFE